MQKYILLLVFSTPLQSANKSPVTCYIFNGGTTYSQKQANGTELTATYDTKYKSYSSSESKLELSLNSFLGYNIGNHGKLDYMRLRELYNQQQKSLAAAAENKK